MAVDEIIRAIKLSAIAISHQTEKDQGNNNVAEGWKLKAESYVRFLDTANS